MVTDGRVLNVEVVVPFKIKVTHSLPSKIFKISERTAPLEGGGGE